MKVLLFGASLGGKNFMKNHANEYEFLAIIDNDKNKKGKLLGGIPIITPKQISDFTYDKIIVTSMYVKSISEQLEELKIPQNKIEYASKNSMKVDELPFENPVIIKKANQLIVKISKILKDVPHFYTFGTLLGIARDERLIPWDDDIDIAIFATDVSKIQSLLVKNMNQFEELFDVHLFLRVYSNGNPASITLDCIENGHKQFMVNFDCMYVDGNMVKQELNDTPIKFFEGHDELTFKGTSIQVPKDYEAYLDYSYGDWHTVKKNTSFVDNTISFKEPEYSCSIQEIYVTNHDE